MSRTLPTECDRCGGIVDWGDFGPDPDDNLAGTTCSCPTGQMRDDLALALRLLDELMRHGGFDRDGQRIKAEAHDLLVRHGIREGTA